jgi:hypothetical protein
MEKKIVGGSFIYKRRRVRMNEVGKEGWRELSKIGREKIEYEDK